MEDREARALIAALERIAGRDDARVWDEISKLRDKQHSIKGDLGVLLLELGNNLTEHVRDDHIPMITRITTIEERLQNTRSDVEDSKTHNLADLRRKWWETGWGKVVLEVVKVLAAAAVGAGLVKVFGH